MLAAQWEKGVNGLFTSSAEHVGRSQILKAYNIDVCLDFEVINEIFADQKIFILRLIELYWITSVNSLF